MLFRVLATVLAVLILTACSKSDRQWAYGQNITHSPLYNSGRMFLPTDQSAPYFAMELIRCSSGMRLYLNILVLEAPPHPHDPSRTCVTILFENDSLVVYPYLLKGGQRLLFPPDVTEYLINQLLDEHSFTVAVGHRKFEVIPGNFKAGYDQLKQIPISPERKQ